MEDNVYCVDSLMSFELAKHFVRRNKHLHDQIIIRITGSDPLAKAGKLLKVCTSTISSGLCYSLGTYGFSSFDLSPFSILSLLFLRSMRAHFVGRWVACGENVI
jgi:hypothetical protein